MEQDRSKLQDRLGQLQAILSPGDRLTLYIFSTRLRGETNKPGEGGKFERKEEMEIMMKRGKGKKEREKNRKGKIEREE